MSKVKYNVGWLKGSNGTGNIYLAETDGGTEFLAMLWLVTIEGSPVEKWKFTPRSTVQSHIGNQLASMSGDIDLSKMPETAPSGLEDADGYIVFSNATGLPRVYDESKGFFSIRGTGIAEYTGANSAPITANNAKAGTTTMVLQQANARTLTETVNEVVEFVSKNLLMTALIVFIALELFGVTNVLGLKKKKGRRR